MAKQPAVSIGAMSKTTPTDRARQDKRREAPFGFRPTNGRRNEFLRRVEASGMSVNAFLNQAVFSRGTKVNCVLLADALTLLAAIKDELRKSTCKCSTCEALHGEMTLARNLLMRGLGKRG